MNVTGVTEFLSGRGELAGHFVAGNLMCAMAPCPKRLADPPTVSPDSLPRTARSPSRASPRIVPSRAAPHAPRAPPIRTRPSEATPNGRPPRAGCSTAPAASPERRQRAPRRHSVPPDAPGTPRGAQRPQEALKRAHAPRAPESRASNSRAHKERSRWTRRSPARSTSERCWGSSPSCGALGVAAGWGPRGSPGYAVVSLIMPRCAAGGCPPAMRAPPPRGSGGALRACGWT